MAFALYFAIAFGLGAAWALIIGHAAMAFGYTVAFGLIAVAYVAAACIVALNREAPRARVR